VIKDAGDMFSIGSHVNRALFSPEGSSEVYGNASHRDRAGDAPHPVDRRDSKVGLSRWKGLILAGSRFVEKQ
jgi:hypothetical protein